MGIRHAWIWTILALLSSGPASADVGLEALSIRVAVQPGGAATLAQPPAPFPPANALPDGRPGFGDYDIAEAWLIAPTGRYAHGVLGDALEAGGVRVVMRDGRSIEYLLDRDSVFEDLTPRVVDLDNDFRDEVMVVRSHLAAGAALAVFRVFGETLELMAETSPIGTPNRWLNPVGIGDFDGDGAREIAYVETPHIGGILRIVALRGTQLVEVAAARGFSNHAIGSRALGLSAVLDLDGDGRDELLIPADGRGELRIVGLVGTTVTDLGRVRHDSPIETDFVVADRDGNGRADVAYGLANGSLVVLNR